MIDLFAHRSPLTVEGGVETFDVITGTTGNDTLDGTSGADSISGLDGDDVIDGHEGDDFIDGGPGADLIHGGTGADTILGGDGNDLIYTSETQDDGLGDSVDGGLGNDQFLIGSSHSTPWSARTMTAERHIERCSGLPPMKSQVKYDVLCSGTTWTLTAAPPGVGRAAPTGRARQDCRCPGRPRRCGTPAPRRGVG